MAFPIPAHLPRKDADVSTILLTKMSEATPKSLSFEVASSWVSELEAAILQTKRRIHDRVQSDLPAFEQQLASSRSVQERLRSLGSNVDTLSTVLCDPETGMIPNLIMTLSQHASLAQEVADAEVKYETLAYLSQCKRAVTSLTALADEGRLPDAMDACAELDRLLEVLPSPLENAYITTDLKRRYRSVKDRTQEQLLEAFSRGVVVSPTEIVIRSPVQVRQSDTLLSLSSIISALSPSSLTDRLGALRRDLISHYVDHVLTQPFSVEVSTTDSESRLMLFPTPPNTEDKGTRIDNLSTVITFLADALFPHISPGVIFPRTLSKPVTSGLLSKLLVPSLPSSLDQLPPYLSLLRRAVDFEEAVLSKSLGDMSSERDIKSWADSITSHYERKRRTEILDRARAVILREADESDQFRAEMLVVPDTPKEPEVPQERALVSKLVPAVPVIEEEAAWGFEEDGDASIDIDEAGWGLDDDDAAEEIAEPPTKPEGPIPTEEEDPGDAWGWKDDESEPIPTDDVESEDSSAWDDPWGEEDVAPAATPAPKPASRLEKHAGRTNGVKLDAPLHSPSPLSAPPPTPAMPPPVQTRKVAEPQVLKESYLVSSRVKELLFLIEDVLREAEELSSAALLSSSSGSPVGTVIGQSAAMILDLYRGLHPVTFANQLAKMPKRSMCFSNDCLWVWEEVGRVLTHSQSAVSATSKTKLIEGQERLKILSDSWYEDAIDTECQNVNDNLDGASGFTETADQERFDECESAVNDVLQGVRKWSQQVKPVLTKGKYYTAIGAVVDAALSRMLQDVLALPDIPEVESHKLSELCRILSALEALFVEDVEQPSFVVAYVPSWLKFSYLSELLEASMADIAYLFEEGALVDFEIEELVKLVRALFADTPLRANTVNKLMQGHPMHS
ncbi:hypothetical protein EUX98_g6676 [Antrodiella citrinella]|uniref:Uncharacterized protein n=1 Tax=Antrodiella citrinella TaxID=2447956 RepID=A0A4S4MNE5_9APHY|nr:hypothetical protein EUX98_g6676 [Antrodiella citrinella]